MIAKRHWKTGNVAAVILAMIICTGLLMYSDYSRSQAERAEEQRRAAALPDRWLVVRNIAVPDFVEGADPLITYSREIRETFIGEWIVEVHRVGDDDLQICTGTGRARYEKGETIPDAGVRLSWFIGTTCNFVPGKYILDATWLIQPDGYPEKQIRFLSNPFMVLPRGAQLYVTPQQVQKLAE